MIRCANVFVGAVVYAVDSAVTIRNCFFYDNQALKLGRGSAVFSMNSNINIEHSVFLQHKSSGNGGVIYASRNSNVAILDSFFEGKVLTLFLKYALVGSGSC